MITNQEEYDVILEIPDSTNEDFISAKIYAKIQFIWSYYIYYKENLIKTEENLQNIQIMLLKKKNILKHLDGKFF